MKWASVHCGPVILAKGPPTGILVACPFLVHGINERVECPQARLLRTTLSVGSVHCFEILGELQIGVGHDLEMVQFQIDLCRRFLLDIVLLSLGLGIEFSECEGRLTCISDLTSVPSGVFLLPPVLASRGYDLVFFDLDPVLQTVLDEVHI